MRRSVWHRLQQLASSLFPASYSWPAMDIRLGDRRLHLAGSIHMGTRDMQPLPAGLLRQLQKADALVVEADITRGSSPFSEGEAYPPLATRLTPETLQQLTALCDELSLNIALFDSLPFWQIALMLQAQQAQRLGCDRSTVSTISCCRQRRRQANALLSWKGRKRRSRC